MRLGILIFLGMLSAGCASDDMWYQKGKTEADMQIDRYDCRTQLRDKYGLMGDDKRTPAYVTELRQCMTGKGYALVEEKKK